MKQKVAIYSWILMVMGIITAAATVLIMVGPKGREVREISLGNKFLTEANFDDAVIEYSKAVEINPNSREALEGLMQAAYMAENYDVLTQTLTAYANVMLEQGMDEEAEHMLCIMTKNAYGHFESEEKYITFVDLITEDAETDELINLKKETRYAIIAKLILDEEFDEANRLLEEFVKNNPDENLERAKANVLAKCAEIAWKNREFDKAVDFLKEALECAKNEQDIKDYLLRVISDYATALKNNQEYDKATELIRWLQEVRGDDSLSGIITEIEEVKVADEQLQGLIETLNGYFEADDIAGIKELMLSDSYQKAVSKFNTVFYSSNVKNGDSINGKGTAIYNVYGSKYVYYGNFVDGKREGSGLWYYINRGTLAKFTLEWSNNLPNGAGTGDFYSTTNIAGYGGAILGSYESHSSTTFTTKNGIYDGLYTYKSTTNDGYSYTASCTPVNGYAPRIEPGSYPQTIVEYSAYPAPLLMYASYGYGGYVWWDWTPEPLTVDGFYSYSQINYGDGNVQLTLE